MGVDMGSYDDLIAHKLSIEQIQKHIGSNSIHFLSLDGMMQAVGRKTGYCTACFTGRYPIEIEPTSTKMDFEKTIT
jgi:amidophosphoribosyltransferase